MKILGADCGIAGAVTVIEIVDGVNGIASRVRSNTAELLGRSRQSSRAAAFQW
jgi:hypothetical protein